MRKPIALAATAALLSPLVALAAPAQAQTSGVTGVSFGVDVGTLTITTTASAAQGSAVLESTGARATIPLGTTTVKDTRLTATSWSMTAATSDFTTTGGSIGKGRASFSVELGWTAPSGMVLPVFTTPPSPLPMPVDANGSRTLMTTTLGVLNNGVTFTPVLTVNVPPGSVAGTYTGTVTQSVS